MSVISNIGAFVENVVKIGMTRRLKPRDRIVELGDASVPFPFDTHLSHFSEDAVARETEIHKLFADRRLNHVNRRREFFFVERHGSANGQHREPSSAMDNPHERALLPRVAQSSRSTGGCPRMCDPDSKATLRGAAYQCDDRGRQR